MKLLLAVFAANRKALIAAVLSLGAVVGAYQSGTLSDENVGEALLASTTLIATIAAAQAKLDSRKLWRYLDAATYGIQEAWYRYQASDPVKGIAAARSAVARADQLGVRKELGQAVARLGNRIEDVTRASPPLDIG